jgi:hypothetical protein
MKHLTRGIGGQLASEKQVLASLDSGFGKSKQMVKDVTSKLDTFIGQASGSIVTYVILFTVCLIVLIYKLS